MALILCFETSSVLCSVSLFRDGELLASREEGESYRHSEVLHIFMKDVLDKAGVKVADLDAVAVGSGPGSFTGLRIGYAAAKGMCYGLKKPMISVSTLEVMARAALQLPISHEKYLCPLVDARRMEAYTCLFNEDLSLLRPLEALVVDETTFAKDLEKGPVLFFGSGMEKVRPLYEAQANAHFLDHIMPSSLFMGNPALEKFKAGEFEDMAYAEPLYYKDFQPTTPKRKL